MFDQPPTAATIEAREGRQASGRGPRPGRRRMPFVGGLGLRVPVRRRVDRFRIPRLSARVGAAAGRASPAGPRTVLASAAAPPDAADAPWSETATVLVVVVLLLAAFAATFYQLNKRLAPSPSPGEDVPVLLRQPGGREEVVR